MAVVNFGGLASGLDTAALIDGLMGVQRVPIAKLERKEGSLSAARSALGSLMSKISAVKTKAEQLDTKDEFSSLQTVSSNTAVTSSISGSAVPASYSIDVNQLAEAQKNKSSTYASSDTALGLSGSMDITVGPSSMVSVSIGSGDTLADIATNINASNADVTASIVYDGSNYQMLVKGDSTGASNAVTFAGVDLGLAAGKYNNAQDAEIVFDGSIAISRSNNQFNNVIEGVDFAVSQTTSQSVTLTVDRDQDALVSKITDLVNTYNTAVGYGHALTGHGELTATYSALSGDSSVRAALDRMQSRVSQPISGLSGKYNMLANAGVHTTQGGKLEVDETKLRAALKDDFGAVEKLFVGDPAANVSGVMSGFIDMLDLAVDGKTSLIQVRMDGISTSLTNISDEIFNLEGRLEDYQTQLTKQFTQLELMVARIKAQESALGGLANLPLANPQ